MTDQKLVRFPDADRLRREAAGWLARLDRGLTAEETAAFQQWQEQAGGQQALREMDTTWRDLTELSELAELFPLREQKQYRIRRVPRFVTVVAATGVAAAALLLAGKLLFEREPAPPASFSASAPAWTAVHETATGARETVSLDDGSSVTLNTDTRFRIAYDQRSRTIHLEQGEAHFDVAPDPERPFKVIAGQRIVRALGTAFVVRIHADAVVEVTVTEGRVEVGTLAGTDPGASLAEPEPENPTVLHANQTLRLDYSAPAAQYLSEQQLDQKLAWQRGFIVFTGEPLAQVLAEMMRYTTEEFEIVDEPLKTLRVGGYFRAGDVDGLRAALEQNFQVGISRNPETSTLELRSQ